MRKQQPVEVYLWVYQVSEAADKIAANFELMKLGTLHLLEKRIS